VQLLHRSSRALSSCWRVFPGAPVCDRLPTAEQPVIGQPDLVGHCVSLLPFVVDLQEAETISDFLARVQRELGAAHDHSAFTLVSLLQDLRPGVAVPGVSPISAGLTSVKKYLQHELPQSGFSADYDANPKSFESFEWYLNAVEVDNGLELKCHYDTGLLTMLPPRSGLPRSMHLP